MTFRVRIDLLFVFGFVFFFTARSKSRGEELNFVENGLPWQPHTGRNKRQPSEMQEKKHSAMGRRGRGRGKRLAVAC